MRALARFVLLLMGAMVVAAVTACDGTPASPSVPVLSAPVTAALDASIADEYRAEMIYERVVSDFGQVVPFVNVLAAEQRHSAAIAGVMRSYGLVVPANPWSLGTVPHAPTLSQACATAVTAERENIAMYDGFLALDLPADVRRVFENNRLASLQNHLPAFQRCAP